MADIQKLKETLEQIQATQQALIEKVDKFVSQSESQSELQEVSQEVSQELADEAFQEVSQESSQESSQEVSQESSQESSQEVSQEVSQESSQEVSQEVSQESSQDVVEEDSEEDVEEDDKEPSQDICEEQPQEPSQEVSQESSQEQPQETPKEFEDIDPISRIEEIPEETRKKTSEVNKYDLGDGLHYYEEDGICYIDVDKDDEIIDQVRAKIVSASLIRDYIKNGEFEKIKPYVPEDAYEALYKEYYRWERAQGHLLTDNEKKLLTENEKQIEQKKNELNDVIKQLAGKIPGWKRRQLIPRRDTLRKEINNHRGFIEKIKRGEL